jgi:hypothetical protein
MASLTSFSENSSVSISFSTDETCGTFFYDEAEAVADHERRVHREGGAQGARLWAVNTHKAVFDSILCSNPKQHVIYMYCNRLQFTDFSTFDLDNDKECVKSIHSSFVNSPHTFHQMHRFYCFRLDSLPAMNYYLMESITEN